MAAKFPLFSAVKLTNIAKDDGGRLEYILLRSFFVHSPQPPLSHVEEIPLVRLRSMRLSFLFSICLWMLVRVIRAPKGAPASVWDFVLDDVQADEESATLVLRLVLVT